MPPSPRPYADYLRLGLLTGLCHPEEAIAWADSQAAHYSRLPAWLIDLATGQAKHPLDIVHSLNQVPGPADLGISHRLLIARLGLCYPIPLVLDSSAAIASYHRLIWRLYNQFEADETDTNRTATELESLILEIDQILEWIDINIHTNPKGASWSQLRQAHHSLIAWGAAYRPNLILP